MNCSDVVGRFTDYLDGLASGTEAEAIERHLEGCPSCVRYKNVVVHGAELLRTLPEPELESDFGPRLRNRLHNVDDERVLLQHGASGTPAMTVLGIALVLTAVAWSPALFSGENDVELAPIVVNQEPVRSPARPVRSSPPGVFSTKSTTDLGEGLWANTLLYDYTPLSQRYEQRARGRRAGQLDR
jgi:anti-sigma factor RsiW